MYFYFLRHGQTKAHVEKLICGGGWDLELTEEGLSLAKEAAAQYRDKLADVEKIVCSPLKRTAQTAAFFSEALGLPVEYNSAIAEWLLGEWDRVPYSIVPNLFERHDNPPQGETRLAFRSRVATALEGILREGKVPLLVSHGAVWDGIARNLRLSDTHIPTCLPVKVSLNNEGNDVHYIQ